MADSKEEEQKRAQQERAKRLTEWIENPDPTPQPQSPHEFVEDKMKELDRKGPKKPKDRS